jgi:DNA-directed RNA polymerase I, II, and III subunit RPABC1
VGVKTIKLLAERMRNEGVQRAVMVTQASMTPFAKQCLSEMAPKYYIELFQEAELLVNITKHTLVPHHRILTREEKQTLLDRYKASGVGGVAGWMGGRMAAWLPAAGDFCC